LRGCVRRIYHDPPHCSNACHKLLSGPNGLSLFVLAGRLVLLGVLR
jgi:hypothetical protein